MICTLVFVCIVIWMIAHDPKQPIERHKHKDDETYLTPEQWRVERYMRHKTKFAKPKRRL